MKSFLPGSQPGESYGAAGRRLMKEFSAFRKRERKPEDSRPSFVRNPRVSASERLEKAVHRHFWFIAANLDNGLDHSSIECGTRCLYHFLMSKPLDTLSE